MKLYLDTSQAKKVKVELIDKNKIVDSLTTDSPLDAIEKILKKNNLKVEDIEDIDFHKGPGSFTGLRVGAAVANTLNWALGRKFRSSEIKYK